ncbi:MAG: hypothetical protein WCG29_10675 [Desulfomonile sp.]|jgi:hypothetical protein
MSPDTNQGVLTPALEPSKRFQEQAFNHVSHWCKASAEFVSRKVERWKLLEDLYHNRRDLNSWGARSDPAVAFDSLGLKKDSPLRRDRWRSDIVLAPSYIVDTWADRAYQSIFSGPEWLTVVPTDSEQSSAKQDAGFPSSYKLQELLLMRLSEGQIHVRLYEILQHLVLYGTAYAKIFWYSKGVRSFRWDYESLAVIEESKKIYDCPVVQVIPLDRVLPDWAADHSDVQRFTGIGHRVDKSYEHVLEQYARGVYNLNKERFLDRWENASSEANQNSDQLLQDHDSVGIRQDDTGKLTVWEWHGLAPTDTGHRECLCAIITERGASSPEDGVMVRLTETPVLWSGLRPFLSAHYTPLPGPFGVGAVEPNLDLIHSISQFISQSQDNTRLTANAQLMVRRGSSAARQINSDDDVIYPGKVWTVDDPGDIQPFPTLNFPQQEVNHLIDYLNSLLERRTTVSEITLGVSTRGKTATEAHILQESAMSPFATRTDLFARAFLEPLGKIALSMLQQFLLDDQTITVRNSSGQEVPLVVRSEEIQKSRYRVAATLTRQDSTRLAKAQSIERVLPTLSSFQPILASEGVRISFSELIKRYLDLIGVDGADRVFTRVSVPDETNREEEGSSSPPDDHLSRSPEDPRRIGPSRNSSPHSPPPLLEKGGPMGPNPTDQNALAQFLQIQASSFSQ